MGKASRDFQIFVKPAGATCNLGCRYCYYLPKESLYPAAAPYRMSDDLLEEYIGQHIEIAPEPVINFSWHGGEPTILGLDYFRRIVELQRKHQGRGTRIVNSIQTNGVLIDEDWCRFFGAEGFAVGLSLDGPQDVHDRCRITKSEKPTYKQVIHGYRLLRRYKVPVDILCVVHAENVKYPLQVYRFFKEIKAQYLSFIPLVELDPSAVGGVSPRTVPAEDFGAFLCTIFNEWLRQDIGRVIVQIFEEAGRPTRGQDHSLCVFRPTCGDIPVLEHNGDFYSCDHFVDPGHLLGNLRQVSLFALLENPALRGFGQAKREMLPGWCRGCEVLAVCNGGCPKDRVIKTPEGEGGLNYLCAAYKKFFTHARPYVARLADLRHAGERPEALMKTLQAEDSKAGSKAGRNDPCPCGSGRKYKKCCLVP